MYNLIFGREEGEGRGEGRDNCSLPESGSVDVQ